MGIMVHSLSWVMQELYHQPYVPARLSGYALIQPPAYSHMRLVTSVGRFWVGGWGGLGGLGFRGVLVLGFVGLSMWVAAVRRLARTAGWRG